MLLLVLELEGVGAEVVVELPFLFVQVLAVEFVEKLRHLELLFNMTSNRINALQGRLLLRV